MRICGQDLAGLERGVVDAEVDSRGRATRRSPHGPSGRRSRRAPSSAPACRCRDRRWPRCRRSCRGSAPADRRSAARPRAGSARASASASLAIRSCWVVMAPMTISAPSVRTPLSSATPARSIRWPGCARRSFIIGMRLWPPASTRASSRPPSSATASSRLRGPMIFERSGDQVAPPEQAQIRVSAEIGRRTQRTLRRTINRR